MSACAQGICSVIADPVALAGAGTAWAAAVRAISPALTYVKCPINGGPNGFLPELLNAGAAAYSAAGFSMQWLLEATLAPPEAGPANALPTLPTPYKRLKASRFSQLWTDAATNAILAVPLSLRPTSILLLNEPNLQAAPQTIGSGEMIPYLEQDMVPNALKPSSMAPECYFAFLYYAASRLRQKFPDIAIYPAPVSIAAAFNTSMTDGWVGEYTDRGMRSLVDAGLTRPWPWSGFVANIEGVVSKNYADYVAYGAAKLKGKWGITGPNVWAEWGVPATDDMDESAMRDTCANLAATAGMMSFFQMQTKEPGSLTDYGIVDYSFADGQFMPGTPTRWRTALPPMLEAL